MRSQRVPARFLPTSLYPPSARQVTAVMTAFVTVLLTPAAPAMTGHQPHQGRVIPTASATRAVQVYVLPHTAA
jgi:TPP-dependent indolepyruvate ferredoxin oxidoreductase alpha subunit